jgi:hypothetical protein
MGLAEKKPKSNTSSPKKRPGRVFQYAVCVKNEEYPASLELRKIYQVVPDKQSGNLGLIRIIDESGEDYLYPEDHFLVIKLTPAIERAVRAAS